MDLTSIILEFNRDGIVTTADASEHNKMILNGCCITLSKNKLLTIERLEEAYMLALTGRFTLDISSLTDFGSPEVTDLPTPCGGCGGGVVR